MTPEFVSEVLMIILHTYMNMIIKVNITNHGYFDFDTFCDFIIMLNCLYINTDGTVPSCNNVITAKLQHEL
jgi:hypothetical protein